MAVLQCGQVVLHRMPAGEERIVLSSTLSQNPPHGGRTDDDASSVFTSLLFGIRPLWQLGILVLYAVIGHDPIIRAIEAVGAAALIASNFVLMSKLNHPDWPNVQRITVLIEAGVSTALAAILLFAVHDGPAPLLLLPSAVTYAVRSMRGLAQHLLVALNVLIYALAVLLTLMNHPGALTLTADAWKRWTLMCAYGAVLAFGLITADLLQRQRLERAEFSATRDRLQRQSVQLERINTQLNEYADQISGLSAAEERNRIAGEIHDTVAHRLTALLVQLQAARRILQQGDTTTTEGNLLVCEELARESLEEVRTSVRAVRRTAGDEGIHALRRLSVQYGALTGMDIQFDSDPAVTALPAPMMATLYRAVQEGLTNAQRHGRATQVHLALVRRGMHLHLEIRDNGRGDAAPTLGFGLTAMRERIQQYGGDLTVHSQPALGFTLQLRLPLWEENAG